MLTLMRSMAVPTISSRRNGPHLQGTIALLDNEEADTGFLCVPGSHIAFEKWAATLGHSIELRMALGTTSLSTRITTRRPSASPSEKAQWLTHRIGYRLSGLHAELRGSASHSMVCRAPHSDGSAPTLCAPGVWVVPIIELWLYLGR